jgi:hypothetical protein
MSVHRDMLQLIMDTLDVEPDHPVEEVYMRVGMVRSVLGPILAGPVDTFALEGYYSAFLRMALSARRVAAQEITYETPDG